jgi:hypothetical protein
MQSIDAGKPEIRGDSASLRAGYLLVSLCCTSMLAGMIGRRILHLVVRYSIDVQVTACATLMSKLSRKLSAFVII